MIMKKKYAAFLLAFFCSLALWAQDDLEWAPRNPQFLQYQNKLKSASSKTIVPEYRSDDYVPMPVNFNFDDYFNKKLKNTNSLPSSFDLRTKNMVTSVKNQGQVGTCWAFATLGSVESHWLMMGLPAFDLSEQHLATCHGFLAKPDNGGNDYYAAAYFSRYAGPYLETDDPYSQNKNATCNVMTKKPVARIPMAKWIPDDQDLIKKYLMTYGAISSAMFVDPVNLNNFYNKTDHTYCYGGTQSINHGVLIVGWDDNKTVTGGPQSPQNLLPGVWIVRNSWGTAFGEQGYFYISYYDSRFLNTLAIYPEREGITSASDSIYCYDQLGGYDAVGYSKHDAYGLTKFTTKDNKPEYLTKVGTFVHDAGAQIDIEVYGKKDGNTLSNLIASRYGLICDFPGYYTFDILAQVQADFYVKVKYNSPGGNYPIPAETVINGFATPNLHTGVSWISKDSLTWSPVGKGVTNYEMDLSIRAYTRKTPLLPAFFTFNKTEVCTGSQVIMSPNKYPANYSLTWDFGSGATPATSTSKENQTVSYSAGGEKTIRLIVDDNAGNKDTLLEKLSVVNLLNVQAIASNQTAILGRSIQLVGVGEAELWQWTPSTNLTSPNSKITTMNAATEGTMEYTVKALQGVCTGEANVFVQTLRPPANDDACNAIELSIGILKTFDNSRATVEEHEPMVDTVSVNGIDACNTQHTWCNEGGLHHTIWFKFKAPATGVISIDTKQLDTKIALYDVSTCTDLFVTGGYTLLAANDDYNSAADKFGAAITRVANLTPGKYYYIQVDGSGGGAEGPFTILLQGNGLAVDDVSGAPSVQQLKVYPNPSQGVFNAEITLTGMQKIKIDVTDLSGAIVQSKTTTATNLQYSEKIDLSSYPKGVYILKVSTNEGTFNQKLIVQ